MRLVEAALLASAPMLWRGAVPAVTMSAMPRPSDFGPPSLDAAMQMLHSASDAANEQSRRLGSVGEPLVEGGGGAPPAVHLVGVGPGDVELLTVKALRLMRDADLVLYDRLISPEVLSLVNPDASMLYVGKEAGLHTRPQEEIHALLEAFARSGRTVVRLKGGDPCVFGRGGEELNYLEERGIPVHIVPGITAASGIAAGLHIPLTHRDHADAVRFVTGHARSECTTPVADRYDWVALADARTTLVIYMGLSTLPELVDGLLTAGLHARTPAVAVQDGTMPSQRVVAAPLADLAAEVDAAELKSPTLVVIGDVVSMMSQKREGEAEAANEGRTVQFLDADEARELVRIATDARAARASRDAAA